MLDFHLSVQPKTEQRLKMILNSIEDEENFSQSIINDQIARLQRSIFNFLNPNYLGKEAQFRKSFEIRLVRNIISSLKYLHHKQPKEYNSFLMFHSFS